MFTESKTLIVVYKDEMLMNQLKKLIESNDDTDGGSVVGTRDDSINVVSWTEEVWLGNKKAGNIKDKVIFLGDIKGTEKLIPVIDMKFNEYGVKFGWAGNQAVLYIDPKALGSREDYLAFLKKLAVLPVPEIIKNGNKPKAGNYQAEGECDSEQETANVDEEASGSAGIQKVDTPEEKHEKKPGLFQKAKAAIESGADAVSDKFKKVSSDAVVFAEDLFRDKAIVKRQMLFYGVVNLYDNCLEAFINM